MKTKKVFIAVLFLFTGFSSFSQMQFDTLSQIEKFYAQKSSAIETYFYDLGKVGRIEMYVTKMYDLKMKDSISGIRMSIRGIDNQMVEYKKNTMLDVNEVNDLIVFIEKVASRIATNHEKTLTEFHYLSKSQFLCHVSNTKKKAVDDWKIILKVDSRNYNTVEECKAPELLSFLKLLKQAKAQLF